MPTASGVLKVSPIQSIKRTQRCLNPSVRGRVFEVFLHSIYLVYTSYKKKKERKKEKKKKRKKEKKKKKNSKKPSF